MINSYLFGSILLSLLKSLLITLAVELALSLILRLRGRDLLIVLLANVVTNPPLCLALDLVYIGTAQYPPIPLIAALEIAAVLIEGLIYQKTLKYKRINPFLLSLILNAASYLCGLLIP